MNTPVTIANPDHSPSIAGRPCERSPRLQVLATAPNAAPAYVYRDAVSLQLFVNRYIRTRRRPVNPQNRLAVQQAIETYDGRFPARCADLESYLDELLIGPSANTL